MNQFPLHDRIILNNEDGLIKGTQLPFIQKAQELNYDIVVMNTNENYANNDHRSPLKVRLKEY